MRQPVVIPQSLYDQAKSLGLDLTGYVASKPLPTIKGGIWKVVYSPYSVSHYIDSMGYRIERKPPAQSFSLRPGAINQLKA